MVYIPHVPLDHLLLYHRRVTFIYHQLYFSRGYHRSRLMAESILFDKYPDQCLSLKETLYN